VKTVTNAKKVLRKKIFLEQNLLQVGKSHLLQVCKKLLQVCKKLLQVVKNSFTSFQGKGGFAVL